MKYHCLFEQSGTFKNEFIKLGFQAEDYDILNDFNQTDHVIDLYEQIEKAYINEPSIFDSFNKGDYVLAFFPCTRFEAQILLWFRGENYGQRTWNDVQKLEYNLKLHEELNNNYEIISKLTLICMKRNFKLIIENPYCEQHYLTRYWCIKPSIIDYDRRKTGDFFKKPTQYFFINCEPKNNFIFEGQDIKNKKNIVDTHDKVERSMISPDYANRFIREYIIDELDSHKN